MKNPLTSKERRGLLAVAAAALLCIGSGFIFRNCGGRNAASANQVVIVDSDSVAVNCDSRNDSILCKSKKKSRSESSNGKRSRREKRKKVSTKRAEKVYPSRSPLDEPCD